MIKKIKIWPVVPALFIACGFTIVSCMNEQAIKEYQEQKAQSEIDSVAAALSECFDQVHDPVFDITTEEMTTEGFSK